MKRGLKGFAFLVSGLVLGIIGATASVTAIALSAVGPCAIGHKDLGYIHCISSSARLAP